jgi:hypothetical protein
VGIQVHRYRGYEILVGPRGYTVMAHDAELFGEETGAMALQAVLQRARAAIDRLRAGDPPLTQQRDGRGRTASAARDDGGRRPE